MSELAELNIKLGQLKFLAYINYALIKKCQEQYTSLIGSVFLFIVKKIMVNLKFDGILDSMKYNVSKDELACCQV